MLDQQYDSPAATERVRASVLGIRADALAQESRTRQIHDQCRLMTAATEASRETFVYWRYMSVRVLASVTGPCCLVRFAMDLSRSATAEALAGSGLEDFTVRIPYGCRENRQRWRFLTG